jgi:phosphatidylserine synthase
MRLFGWVMLAIIGILATLMVSTIRYTSFKNVGPSSNKPFLILPLLSLLVAGIWFYSQYVLLALACFYAFHGLVLKAFGLIGRFRQSNSPKTDDRAASVDN